MGLGGDVSESDSERGDCSDCLIQRDMEIISICHASIYGNQRSEVCAQSKQMKSFCIFLIIVTKAWNDGQFLELGEDAFPDFLASGGSRPGCIHEET